MSLDSLVRVLVCAIGVGLLVSAFTLVWKHLLKIEVTRRELSILCGGVIGLLAGFRFTSDYQRAATISLIIVGGSFFLKLVMRLMGK